MAINEQELIARVHAIQIVLVATIKALKTSGALSQDDLNALYDMAISIAEHSASEGDNVAAANAARKAIEGFFAVIDSAP